MSSILLEGIILKEKKKMVTFLIVGVFWGTFWNIETKRHLPLLLNYYKFGNSFNKRTCFCWFWPFFSFFLSTIWINFCILIILYFSSYFFWWMNLRMDIWMPSRSLQICWKRKIGPWLQNEQLMSHKQDNLGWSLNNNAISSLMYS